MISRIATFCLALILVCPPIDADVIDTSIHHQIIENFGASDAWTMKLLGNWSEANKNKLADLLFSTDRGIGLSLWRFNIGGGINHQSIDNPMRTVETFEVSEGKYDWTRQAGERWFANAARLRGVPYLLGFVNSPPGRMTRNGLTNSGDDEQYSTNLKPGFEGQYAAYLCDIVQHFAGETDPHQHLQFDYLSPVNEPQIDWARGSQEGNHAGNQDIKNILLALHSEIEKRNMTVKIRAPESNSVAGLWKEDRNDTKKWKTPFGDYFDAFLRDPAIASLLDHTICYHDYDCAFGPSVEPTHRELGEHLAKFPDAKIWMSEVCILSRKRDLGMPMALEVARLIHADLALGNASAWEWWLAVSTGNYKDGLLYTDYRKPGDPESIILSKTFWALGNFSRFVRPGMIRVDFKGDQHESDGVLGSAYAGLTKLVLVYVNSSKQPQSVKWRFTRAAPPSFMPYTTSVDQDLVAGKSIASDAGYELPPESIVTFAGSYK
jgi:O-glycosyl hydrolase